jgi:hypothetical protein
MHGGRVPGVDVCAHAAGLLVRIGLWTSLAWLQHFLVLSLFAGSHVLKGVSLVFRQPALPRVGLVSANPTHPAFGWL